MRKRRDAHPDGSLVRGRGASSRRSYKEAFERVLYLKDLIENKGLYKLLWRPAKKREADIQMLYRATWFGAVSDVNREVNNGRGSVDFKLSQCASDASVVEFKYASSSKLKRNLLNQVGIYKRSCDCASAIFVIVYFTAPQLAKVQRVLHELAARRDDKLVLIDARRDNKPTGSIA